MRQLWNQTETRWKDWKQQTCFGWNFLARGKAASLKCENLELQLLTQGGLKHFSMPAQKDSSFFALQNAGHNSSSTGGPPPPPHR